MIDQIDAEIKETKADTVSIKNTSMFRERHDAWLDHKYQMESEAEDLNEKLEEVKKAIVQKAKRDLDAKKAREASKRGIEEQRARLDRMRQEHHRKLEELANYEERIANEFTSLGKYLDDCISFIDSELLKVDGWLKRLD